MSKSVPDQHGHFGEFGGRYVAETLLPALTELDEAYRRIRRQRTFRRELKALLHDYVGRPTPLYHARRLSEYGQGAQIYLKREDLDHTGAHKINNTVGQILLAKYMGKKRIIAETGAGQHGVATATVCALFNLPCDVFMGRVDIERQKLNVFRMKLLGANVVPVAEGRQTLKEAMNAAIRDWTTNIRETYYLIGTVSGPHPYPMIVRDFQRVIGDEVRRQFKRHHKGRMPDALVACIGGGSNAMGLFYPFLRDTAVKKYGVEAAGKGLRSHEHAASISAGQKGILHGTKSYVLQDRRGQILEAYSISAGLDYPGVGPEHAYLSQAGTVDYVSITDREAMAAFKRLSRLEGIIPALESAHAVAYALKLARDMSAARSIVVNLSGRGDKDTETASAYFNEEGTS